MGLGVAAVVQVLLGGVLVALGGWGRRHAGELVPFAADEDDRTYRSGRIAAGGRVCQVAGLVLAVFAVLTALAAVAGLA